VSQPSTQRPPQVTLAGSVVMFASVLVVLTVWDSVANLRSLETREGIESFLAEPMGSGLGLDVEGIIRLLHISGLVAGTCAAATAVLGWFVMRRDKGARLALAVLAVPLFLTGLVAGGFASSFVAAAAAMLWLSPAREWFATGRWTPPPSRQSRAAEQERRPVWPPTGPAQPPADRAPGGEPPPVADHAPAAAPPAPPPASPPYAGARVAPYGDPAQHLHRPQGAAPQERPSAVVTAVVLTTVLGVLAALLAVLTMIVVGMSPELVMEELERQRPALAEGTSISRLQTSTYVTGATCLLLCALALTLAGFVTVGRDWARRGLMITAAFSAGACFLTALMAPVALLPAAAAVTTVVLLARPESRAWCRSSGPPRRR